MQDADPQVGFHALEGLKEKLDLPVLPRDGKAVANGPPWFIAFVLYDGDSLVFCDFIRDRIHTLGPAWGREVLLRLIGHAGQHDAVYEEMRSAARAEADARDVERYEALVKERGGSHNHDLRETQRLVDYFGLTRSDLPAIVLQTMPPAPQPAILRVRPNWLSSDGARRILSDELQRGLAPAQVSSLVQDCGGSVAEMSSRMQILANSIQADVGRRMAGLPTARRETAAYKLQDEVTRHALVLETATIRAFLHKRDLQLTPLLFGILLQLAEARRAGLDWVTRDHLQNHIWSSEARGDSTIDNAIHRLRRALGKHKNLVETRRGIGHGLKMAPCDIRIL